MRCRRRRSPWQLQGSTRRASPGRGTQPEPLQRAQVAVAAVDVFTCEAVYHRPPRYNSVLRVMSSAIIEYLSARPDSATFLTPLHYAQTLEGLFPRSESVLPQPYKIFPADETQPAVLGFPLTETPLIKGLYAKWTLETRELMTQLAAKAASMLDGEEQRALAFFRLLQDDVLILTEEFIGPHLRELRSFINGYLRRDFQAFRDAFEKLRSAATELLQRDRSFAAALPFLGGTDEQGITVALLLDPLFQTFLFDHPA